jgi:hypothetical protein
MAYTIVKTDAFSIGENEEGYDYQPSNALIEKIAKTAVGRFYIDEEGNAVYESRNVRVE